MILRLQVCGRTACARRLALGLVLALAFSGAAPGTDAKGVELFIAEDYKGAARAFEESVQERPDDAESLVWLGRAYGRRAERATGVAKLGAFSLARKVRVCFERAVEADPGYLPGLGALLSFYIDAPTIVGGGIEKARGIADQIAKADRAGGLRARAAIHRAQGTTAEAETLIREAIELQPHEVGHQLALASLLSRAGRFDESDNLFGELSKQHRGSPQVWYSRASELVRAERKPDQARRLLERYLSAPLDGPDAEPYSDARKLLEKL